MHRNVKTQTTPKLISKGIIIIAFQYKVLLLHIGCQTTTTSCKDIAIQCSLLMPKPCESFDSDICESLDDDDVEDKSINYEGTNHVKGMDANDKRYRMN